MQQGQEGCGGKIRSMHIQTKGGKLAVDALRTEKTQHPLHFCHLLLLLSKVGGNCRQYRDRQHTAAVVGREKTAGMVPTSTLVFYAA